MPFAHDTEVALQGAAALVNSRADEGEPGTDTLTEVSDLARFVTDWSWSGEPVVDEAALAQVRALRPRLRRAWEEGDDEDFVALVNDLLADARALPRLVRHDDFGWHVHATPDDAPIARRMQVEAAMALVDVVRAGERSRLRVCAAQDCDDVLVDLSRNRSRRFCESGCGNRLAAAAYRARRSAD